MQSIATNMAYFRIEQIQRTAIHTATIRKINDDTPIATCIQGDNKIFSFETLKKRYENCLTIIFYIMLICVKTERNTYFLLSVNVIFKRTGSERRHIYALETRGRGF